MKVLGLPDLVVVEIFIQLSGKSLHRCRQVCKAWNIFILENIWKYKYARDALEKRLIQNWNNIDPKNVETEEVFDLTTSNVVNTLALTENLFVVESKDSRNNLKEYRSFLVHNTQTKEVWKIEDVGPINEEDDMTVVDASDDLITVCFKKVDSLELDHLAVWSTHNHNLIFEEDVSDFCDLILDQSRPILVYLQSHKVNVLKFDGSTATATKISCNSDILLEDPDRQATCTNINYPNIVHCQQMSTGLQVFVWEIDDERKQLEKVVEINNFRKFANLKEATVEDIFFVNSCFIVLSIETMNHTHTCGDDFISKLTIVTQSGDILKKFKIDSGFYYGRLLLHEHKLCSVLVREPLFTPRKNDEVYLFDVHKLLKSGSGEVPHKTLFSSNHNDWPDQKHALGRTSMTRLSFHDDEDKKCIKLKTLNFWSVL